MAKIKFENGMTVNFDGNPTPADVEEVAKSLGIGQEPQAQQANQSRLNNAPNREDIMRERGTNEGRSGLSNAMLGSGKAGLGFGLGTGRLLSQIGSAALAVPALIPGGQTFRESYDQTRSKAGIFNKESQSGKNVDAFLERQGGVQKGFGIGTDVASFLAPSTAITKAGLGAQKLVAGTGQASKAQRAGGLGARAGTEGASYAGIAALQEGELNKDVATTGAIAGAFPVAGAGIRAIKNAGPTKSLGESVGRVVQAKTQRQLNAAKDALENVSLSGVKTFKELETTLGNNISTIAKEVDSILNKFPERLTPNMFTRRMKSDAGTVSQNFVMKALDDLGTLANSADDAVGAANIKFLKDKANNAGLTLKEINDIARRYGSEFKSKAFNAVGDPKTTVSAQSFENTRKGVKDTLRELLPDDATKILDRQMSNLITTKELATKLSDKARIASQKARKAGLAESVVKGIVNTADTLSVGTISGLGRAIASKSGVLQSGSKNILELEKELSKNIKVVEKLSKAIESGDKKEIAKYLRNFTPAIYPFINKDE